MVQHIGLIWVVVTALKTIRVENCNIKTSLHLNKKH